MLVRQRLARPTAVALLTSLFLSTFVISGAAAQDVPPPTASGQWSEVLDWPFIPIHASVDQDGNVLTYGGSGVGGEVGPFVLDVWNPELGSGQEAHTTTVHDLGTNLFCSIAVSNPIDPGTIILGGTVSRGLPNFVAQYSDGQLTEFAPMHHPRWYGTGTVLPDGRILMQGGVPLGDESLPPIDTAEVYSAEAGWTLLTGTTPSGAWEPGTGSWWYPKSFVTPAGKVWNIGDEHMFYLDPDGVGAVQRTGEFSGTNTGGTSTAVQYAPGKVLLVGAGRDATIVDMNFDPPQLMEAAPMHKSRLFGNAVVLPDGRVMVVGGSGVYNENTDVAYAPEIWDPQTNTWTLLAESATPRLYHSTALLLPDGRVFSGGGGAPGPQDHTSAEIFEPPYLFDDASEFADRPQILDGPASIGYGDDFEVTVDREIARTTMIKVGNSTHSMTTQIFKELGFVQDGSTVTIAGPDLATVMTPGDYMLFTLDSSGVPSRAHIMHVGGDGLTPSPAQANPNPAETIVPWTPPVIVPPRVPVVEAPVVEPPVVEPPVVEPPVIDAGTVELTQQTAAEWTTVGFDTPFDDPPVVVAGPPTAGEADAAVVQVRNVTTSEFEIRLREWDHLDGPHARELVSWIASMPGTHVVDGNVVTAGVADAIGSSWQRVDYPAFSARPVVLTQSMGDENDAPTVVAVKRLNRFGFTARLRGTEGSTITATQSVGFIALERGRIDVGDTRLVAGVRAITDRWKRVADRPAGTKPGILGNLQSNREPDPTTLRIRYRGDRVQIRMNEDTMLDSETSHRRERIGWVRIVPVD